MTPSRKPLVRPTGEGAMGGGFDFEYPIDDLSTIKTILLKCGDFRISAFMAKQMGKMEYWGPAVWPVHKLGVSLPLVKSRAAVHMLIDDLRTILKKTPNATRLVIAQHRNCAKMSEHYHELETADADTHKRFNLALLWDAKPIYEEVATMAGRPDLIIIPAYIDMVQEQVGEEQILKGSFRDLTWEEVKKYERKK